LYDELFLFVSGFTFRLRYGAIKVLARFLARLIAWSFQDNGRSDATGASEETEDDAEFDDDELDDVPDDG
jgi:hypothetical protein